MRHKKHNCYHCKQDISDSEGEWHKIDSYSRWFCWKCWTEFLGPVNVDTREILNEQ